MIAPVLAEPFRPDRARPRRPRVPQQARPRAGRAGRPGRAARAAPDLLRQLRLALLRARLLAAGRGCCGASRHAGGRRDPRAVRRAPSPRDKVAGELAYLARPSARGFERPYGWAWLLMLQAELARHARTRTAAGRRRCGRWPRPSPSASATSCPRPTYPIRAGDALQHRLRAGAGASTTRGRAATPRSRTRRSRSGAALVRWRPRLPGLGARRRRLPVADADRGRVPAPRCCRPRSSPPGSRASCRALAERRAGDACSRPAAVSDRSDGKIAHLDGLNLSRAWCWRHLAADDPAAGCPRPICGTPPTGISPPACRTSPATTWASTGWRRFALLALEAAESESDRS